MIAASRGLSFKASLAVFCPKTSNWPMEISPESSSAAVAACVWTPNFCTPRLIDCNPIRSLWHCGPHFIATRIEMIAVQATLTSGYLRTLHACWKEHVLPEASLEDGELRLQFATIPRESLDGAASAAGLEEDASWLSIRRACEAFNESRNRIALTRNVRQRS
jgi:hypothetical protein